ncbi:hypothetical protein NDU88_001235 [Pleurodeles waltl]|uniref:Uncharacterized protein n=1 Tax=Pleurodeles waltl TaxID=8319 RepID=A0AAV7Q965_PLEWA|nr:hypothetical protein NDU88_001235 [Pleurodeles waltl]
MGLVMQEDELGSGMAPGALAGRQPCTAMSLGLTHRVHVAPKKTRRLRSEPKHNGRERQHGREDELTRREVSTLISNVHLRIRSGLPVYEARIFRHGENEPKKLWTREDAEAKERCASQLTEHSSSSKEQHHGKPLTQEDTCGVPGKREPRKSCLEEGAGMAYRT